MNQPKIDPSASVATNALPEFELLIPEFRSSSGKIDPRKLLNLLFGKRLLTLGIMLAFIGSGVGYALYTPSLYRSEVVVMLADSKAQSASMASIENVAALAGLSSGASGAQEPIAVLRSRSFGKMFIERMSLMPVLYSPEWDRSSRNWKPDVRKSAPDIRDAITYFQERILKVVEDKKSGLITIGVTWTDPDTAALWANKIVQMVNAKMRETAIAEAERTVQYLQENIQSEPILAVQQSVGRALEAQLQKLVIARAREEYAYKIIDPATAPKHKIWPKRLQIAFAAFLAGIIISALAGFVASLVQINLRNKARRPLD